MSDKTNADIGALWLRSKEGKEYMTGTITIDGVAHEVVIFKNGFKEKPNQPDWRIYKSKPRDEVAAEATTIRIDDEPEPSSIPF